MAAIAAARVTATHAATALCASGRQSVLVKNLGSVSVDVGAATVAYGAGFPLAPGESLTIELREEPAIVYAITSGSGVTCVVGVMKVAIS